MSEMKLPEGLMLIRHDVTYIKIWCPACGEVNWTRLVDSYSKVDADATKCWNCGVLMIDEGSWDFVGSEIEDLEEGEDWRECVSYEDGKESI